MNGKQTLAENIADNGGLSLAFSVSNACIHNTSLFQVKGGNVQLRDGALSMYVPHFDTFLSLLGGQFCLENAVLLLILSIFSQNRFICKNLATFAANVVLSSNI